ncbi:hypothetical protein M514_01675 [Trichuris suis]|uniref:Uncharacterized protein n=1 Tax=Trichuris suis TaxID=68888 RepID=A0A085MK26_9BILA|nr:hypothetical protein M513_01675 [Trichuris suis]KFD64861.1 hypothetical protein M514_01675 [Trichuris suis]
MKLSTFSFALACLAVVAYGRVPRAPIRSRDKVISKYPMLLESLERFEEGCRQSYDLERKTKTESYSPLNLLTCYQMVLEMLLTNHLDKTQMTKEEKKAELCNLIPYGFRCLYT